MIKMAPPGKTIRWGKNLMAVHPSFANTPQLLKGGASPSPTKLRVDSDKMAAGMRKVKVTINNPPNPGKI